MEVDPTIMDEDEEDGGHGGEGHVHDEHCGHSCTDDTHSHDHGHTHTDHCTSDCHDDHHDHHDHAHEHDHAPKGGEERTRKKKRHNLSLVSSVGYTVSGLLDVAKFNQFMTTLLQTNAANLYRTKGVLAFDGQGDTKFVFQGVHEQVNFGPTEHPWQPQEERLSKLVFIGKNLEPENLKDSIQACTIDPSTAVVTMHKRG